MTVNNGASSLGRVHMVLIPGFGGFDALGNVEYYSGITRQFQIHDDKSAVLHYFDNLPTAAVVTRAARLRAFLAKRIARGEILPDGRCRSDWALHRRPGHSPVGIGTGAPPR